MSDLLMCSLSEVGLDEWLVMWLVEAVAIDDDDDVDATGCSELGWWSSLFSFCFLLISFRLSCCCFSSASSCSFNSCCLFFWGWNKNISNLVLCASGLAGTGFISWYWQVFKGPVGRCKETTGRKEGNVLFNEALNTFYLRLYGVRHMVKNHSDRREETCCCCHMSYSFRLTARSLLYAPSHRQDSTYHSLCYTSDGAQAETRNSSMGPPLKGSIRRPIAPWAKTLLPRKRLQSRSSPINQLTPDSCETELSDEPLFATFDLWPRILLCTEWAAVTGDDGPAFDCMRCRIWSASSFFLSPSIWWARAPAFFSNSVMLVAGVVVLATASSSLAELSSLSPELTELTSGWPSLSCVGSSVPLLWCLLEFSSVFWDKKKKTKWRKERRDGRKEKWREEWREKGREGGRNGGRNGGREEGRNERRNERRHFHLMMDSKNIIYSFYR